MHTSYVQQRRDSMTRITLAVLLVKVFFFYFKLYELGYLQCFVIVSDFFYYLFLTQAEYTFFEFTIRTLTSFKGCFYLNFCEVHIHSTSDNLECEVEATWGK